MASRVRSSLSPSSNQFRKKPVQRSKRFRSQDHKRTLNQQGFWKKKRPKQAIHVRQKSLKRTPLRRQSKKRAAESKVYLEKRRAYLLAHLFCERKGCFRLSRDIHHCHGRSGPNYLDEKTWKALCRNCHDAVHEHPKAAREMGLLR